MTYHILPLTRPTIPLPRGFLVTFYVDTERETPALDTSISHVTWANEFLRAERLRFIPRDVIAILTDELKERGFIAM